MLTLPSWYTSLPVERLTQKALKSLPEYSLSNPSGAFPGKVWKRALNPYAEEDQKVWVICEFVDHPTDPKLLRTDKRRPEIIPSPESRNERRSVAKRVSGQARSGAK